MINSLLALSVPPVITNLLYIGLAILALLIMITIHEFGHYVSGKLLGFKINEFAVGFGKKLYSKTKANGEIFSLRAVPLGGYCAFEGEDKDSNNKDAFNNKEPWKRLIVLFSGAFFNFLSAIVFAVILLTSFGFGDVVEVVEITNQNINPNYISGEGLEPGDVIYGVNGEEFSIVSGDKLINGMLQGYEIGETVIFNIERDGQEMNVELEFFGVEEEDAEGALVTVPKIGFTMQPHAFGFFEAVARSVPFVFDIAYMILVFLGGLITGSVAFSGVGGPITTIGAIATLSQTNIAIFFWLLPLISVNLAVFNLLPFPALDGSRMVFVGIEWIRGKPINPNVEGMIHTVGLIVLLGLVLAADAFQIFSKLF